MASEAHRAPPDPADDDEPQTRLGRVRRFFFGKPKDLRDPSIFHRLSLIPFLAWVGLGADGLSSSAYGPEQAFRALGRETYLALVLGGVMAITVVIISLAYNRIIEQFPFGGGGYNVATKLLGDHAGVVSGSALVVDYVLTITVSVAAAGDALFSFLPLTWLPLKVWFDAALILGLMTLNIRGLRESVLVLAPVFILFLITHAVVIGWGIIAHAPVVGTVARETVDGFRTGLATLGVGGMALLFMRAYSLGGGTYTGIEAVSNGLPIMREPRVQTARRTMLYMCTSLAVTASGLIICYLLWDIRHTEGRTMNYSLVAALFGEGATGRLFVGITLFTEGALLAVAAQAGFMAGPRVVANMAVDSWVPHRFAALSDRLTTQNGILLMGVASLLALVYTQGRVDELVVMYSINVFLTFSLSMGGMALYWFRHRSVKPHWRRRTALFLSGFLLCATILVVTTIEKFLDGGWITLLVTGSFVVVCYLTRRHYRHVQATLTRLYAQLGDLPEVPGAEPPALDATQPTAAILVSSYGGLGIHTLLNVNRAFPGYFRNFVFVSVGVVDSGGFKGDNSIDALRSRTGQALSRYVQLAHRLGLAAEYRFAVGTDAVDEAVRLCEDVLRDYPRTTICAGKVIFERERWYQRLLHNETAFSIQKRLQWKGLNMMILAARLS